MRFFAPVFLIILLMAAPSFAESKEWLKCQTDDDCVKVSDPCGFQIAVNEKYVDDYRKFAEEKAKTIDCRTPKIEGTPVVRCEKAKKICVVTLVREK